MTDRIERELTVEAPPADLVWHAVISDGWLAEEVVFELQPGGDASFRSGDGTQDWMGGGCASASAGRLAFWWASDDDPATRVELTFDADGGRADATPGRRDTSARPARPRRHPTSRNRRQDLRSGAGGGLTMAAEPIAPAPCSAPWPIRRGGRSSSDRRPAQSNGDRARLRAPDLPTGGAQAPGCADRRRAPRPRAVRARGPLPGYAGAAVRCGRRGWPRSVGSGTSGLRAQAAARLSRRYKAPPDGGPRGRARRLARPQRGLIPKYGTAQPTIFWNAGAATEPP